MHKSGQDIYLLQDLLSGKDFISGQDSGFHTLYLDVSYERIDRLIKEMVEQGGWLMRLPFQEGDVSRQ